MKTPFYFSLLFFLMDIFWSFLSYIFAAYNRSDQISTADFTWRLGHQITNLWATYHRPISAILDPLFFYPVVDDHFVIEKAWIFYLYEATCWLQSLILGFFIGLIFIIIYKVKLSFFTKNSRFKILPLGDD